ncbi:glutamine amidotransferase-related protein [Leptolyngbya ohadii]|uniref:glutamine amidotransferase-related protein n=1 Tax=Leptolyngbya ohadii TaxID=1962290 RepID=UPI001CECA543|nr:glutamine amidotransferase [Leptolyngbya ohadii]
MEKILVVVHQETSDPGLVGQVLRQMGYGLDIRCPAIGATLPETMDEHAGAVIFGGPMSANDDDTLLFIRQELDWISIALESGKPYLGICLGAQMLARVLGARVAPHPEDLREIGFMPVQPVSLKDNRGDLNPFAGLTHVYHWHKEGFELPHGAELLVTGETFQNQAYRYGDQAYGVQFHPEITRSMIDLWTEKAAEQLVLPGAQPYDQHVDGFDRHGATVERWLRNFLRYWLLDSEELALGA